MSPKQRKNSSNNWAGYPFLTKKGVELIKRHTAPRIDIGLGIYAPYRDPWDGSFRIGYGSLRIKGKTLAPSDRGTRGDIEKQLVEDLKEFSQLVEQYVYVPLNENRKAAVLSFAHHVGIESFKRCRLLELINSHASKQEIIREWSPFINTIWKSGGDYVINRRRVELDTYLAPDKEIPTLVPHKCHVKYCLLNLPETYNGSPTQVKAIEYLEKKLTDLDPSGEILRRFFRYWNERPSALASPPRPQTDS